MAREGRKIENADAIDAARGEPTGPAQPLKLLALMGLPASGKSTIAELLARRGAHVLDKDRVREALFGPRSVAYTHAQDDVVVEALYDAARFLQASGSAGLVVLDGRTFARANDLSRLASVATELGQPLRLVECRCPAPVARERLAVDVARGAHPARDRRPELYDEIAAAAESTEHPRLVLDTSRLGPRECVVEILRRWPELADDLEPDPTRR